MQRYNITTTATCSTSVDRLYEKEIQRNNGVNRLISLRIAKAYRTISHEALCIITGIRPINIEVEKAVALYNVITGRFVQRYQTDKEEIPKYWLHPAGTVIKLMDNNDDTTDGREDSIQVYTGCNRRNGPDFGRVFLMLNYTEKPPKTPISKVERFGR